MSTIIAPPSSIVNLILDRQNQGNFHAAEVSRFRDERLGLADRTNVRVPCRAVRTLSPPVFLTAVAAYPVHVAKCHCQTPMK